MKVAIVPPSEEYLNNNFFDINNKVLNRDNILFPYYELREHLKENNVELNTIDMYVDLKKIDFVVFFTLDKKYLSLCIKENMDDKLIYCAWEPEVVDNNHSLDGLRKLSDYFKYILTWNDDFIDNVTIFKVNYPYPFLKQNKPDKRNEGIKLLTNISGYKFSNHPKELYSERLRVINYFENSNASDDFEFFGAGWPLNKYKNYGGRIESKFDTYNNFKFALCFENMKDVNGYITEKIFDCFVSNIVPIYWGASNIDEYIPKECYIDYTAFGSIEEMIETLKSMPDERYNKYIEEMNEFISSEKIAPFTAKYFSECLMNVINHDKTAKNFKVKTVKRMVLNTKVKLAELKKLVKKSATNIKKRA